MNIIKGRTSPAIRACIYGVHGIGKSTFACAHPRALALDYERGLEEIGVDRVRAPDNWKASLELIREACSGPGDHQAVVIDTADKLEVQAAALVCQEGKKKTLADFDWGQGHAALEVKWRELLFILEGASDKGRAVILVAHVQSKEVKDPTLGSYAKFIPAMNAKPWAATAQWADAVLFANYEAGMYEGRAVMTGERFLYTQAGTGYDAKNRWGLPKALPLRWEDFSSAVASYRRPAEAVVKSILSLAKTDEDRKKAQEFIEKASGDVPRLVAVESALLKKVSA
jgi:hypothetical protein